jgi:hypothetical protein
VYRTVFVILGAVPQHVDVHSEGQSRSLSRPLDHASDSHTTERLPTLVHENIRAAIPIRRLLAFQSFQAGQFVTFQVMAAIRGSFEPPNNDGAFGKIDIIPPQVATLAYAQAVPVDH